MKVYPSKLKDQFFSDGYVIFNINDNDLIDRVNSDVSRLVQSGNFKQNSRIYSYNDHPRIVESWKISANCKDLAKHNAIFEMLCFLYDSNPRPFSTINFLHSTQQPLHSDYVHFGTIPELRIAGTWIALEDIDENSGPLAVVPKSHLLEIFDYSTDLKLAPPKSVNEIDANYKRYEAWVTETIRDRELFVHTPKMKKGDCIVWAANLLHGSPVCLDNRLTRRSQVTHWDFDDVSFHYNPNFSERSKFNFVKRSVEYF